MNIRNSKIVAFILTIALMLSATVPVAAVSKATGTTVKLEKYSGDVNIVSKNGNPVKATVGMKLYSGYTVEAGSNALAYISLDSSKIVKLNASSSVEVAKNGNKLNVLLKKGQVLFNASLPVDSNKAINIRTNSMVTGIRGTFFVMSTFGVPFEDERPEQKMLRGIEDESPFLELPNESPNSDGNYDLLPFKMLSQLNTNTEIVMLHGAVDAKRVVINGSIVLQDSDRFIAGVEVKSNGLSVEDTRFEISEFAQANPFAAVEIGKNASMVKDIGLTFGLTPEQIQTEGRTAEAELIESLRRATEKEIRVIERQRSLTEELMSKKADPYEVRNNLYKLTVPRNIHNESPEAPKPMSITLTSGAFEHDSSVAGVIATAFEEYSTVILENVESVEISGKDGLAVPAGKTLKLNTSTLTLFEKSTLTVDGELTTDGESVLKAINGRVEVNGKFINDGDTNIGPLQELSINATGVFENKSTLSNEGTITNSGIFKNLSACEVKLKGCGQLANNSTFTNAGTLSIEAASAMATNNGTFTNDGNIIQNNKLINEAGKTFINSGTIDSRYNTGNVALENKGSFTMLSGAITAGAIAIKCTTGSSVHIVAGNITSNNGDVIQCASGSSFNMSGGAIAATDGNGVRCASGSSFNMQGGTITCTAKASLYAVKFGEEPTLDPSWDSKITIGGGAEILGDMYTTTGGLTTNVCNVLGSEIGRSMLSVTAYPPDLWRLKLTDED